MIKRILKVNIKDGKVSTAWKPLKRSKMPRDARKPKKWTLTKADTEYSKYIRNRDGKCVRCGREEMLQNSHFWSRSHKNTRFDDDNCDALCYPCHYGNSKGWEYEKNGEYMAFKKGQLGFHKYAMLEKRAHDSVKQEMVIKELQDRLQSSLTTRE